MKKVVRKLAAKDMLGISLSGLNELARTDPSFPRTIKLGARGRAAGFIEEELDAWIDKKSEEAHCRYAAAKMLKASS
jgi:predicted DNA-binding transcriptional regulator AlpA